MVWIGPILALIESILLQVEMIGYIYFKNYFEINVFISWILASANWIGARDVNVNNIINSFLKYNKQQYVPIK